MVSKHIQYCCFYSGDSVWLSIVQCHFDQVKLVMLLQQEKHCDYILWFYIA